MFDIAIAIPSYNEASTISHVTRQIDIGLQIYFPEQRSIIINADNNSSDGTGQVFIETKTISPKRYISTPAGERGKGRNLKAFFDYAADQNVQAAAVLDGDMESIAPEWIQKIMSPLLDGYDFTFPYYARHRYDGIITSQLCYPVVAGIYGSDIRQPIGGDFGFSGKLVRSLSAAPLPGQALEFGIDIYITTYVLAHALKYCGIALGRKIHRKRDRATLGPMVVDVAGSLFEAIRKSGMHLKTISRIEVPEILGDASEETVCPPVPISTDVIEHQFYTGIADFIQYYQQVMSPAIFDAISYMARGERRISITTEMWCDIVYSLLADYLRRNGEKAKGVQSIVPLFFGRVLSFVNETKENGDTEVEDYLSRQAHVFLAQRNILESAPGDMIGR